MTPPFSPPRQAHRPASPWQPGTHGRQVPMAPWQRAWYASLPNRVKASAGWLIILQFLYETADEHRGTQIDTSAKIKSAEFADSTEFKLNG